MKFKVGDVLKLKSHLQGKVKLAEWEQVEVHAIDEYSTEDRLSLRSHISGNMLKLRQSIVERDFDLIAGPSYANSTQQTWQSQYLGSWPRSTHKYDVGDVLKPLTQFGTFGQALHTLEVVKARTDFTSPHYEMCFVSIKHNNVIMTEEELDKHYTVETTRNKQKAQAHQNPCREIFINGKHASEFQNVSIDFGDMEMRVAALKPACNHNRKYVNGAGHAKFWVCPDCKADLGDA